ncbi:AraC family transcriptional regulator [Myroides sp. M-43]|uniref:helix-turn-helix domain-containing protein n=1 Tax=Myroides oncorhynchi TaxID=2893756 RepID=UPI001E5302AE|nr:AraC family transcriptional regulator [Myroides oncorhynchi]MCC9043575.1 AraC family transcriptional regulator [Myroides oncorhynchi]
MRADLIKDLSDVLEQCFNEFINRLNGRVDHNLQKTILDQGGVVFDRIFYFMCIKKYFGLSPMVYQNPNNRSCVVIRYTTNGWDLSGCNDKQESLKINYNLVIQQLGEFNSFNEPGQKQAICFLIRPKNKVIILSGVKVSISPDSQIFYIWTLSLKVKPVELDNIVIWNKQKLLYKKYYLEYVRLKHINPHISLESYCDILRVHPRTFQRNFKRYLATSFYDYHIQTRLIESVLLLMFSSYSVSEIAYKCGYENYRTFLRAFGKDQPYNPLDYR